MFTDKSKQVTNFMSKLIGKERAPNQCVACPSPNLNFKDTLSATEYTISGMCQSCQDKFEAMYGDD